MNFGFNFGLLGGGSSIDPDLLIHYTFSEIQRVDGDATFDNKGTTGVTNDAIVATGTGLVLGATNDLPLPVGYDLGSEAVSDIPIDWQDAGDATSTFTRVGTDAFSYDITAVSTNAFRPYFRPTSTPSLATGTYLIAFDASITNNPTIKAIKLGGTLTTINYAIKDGYNEIELEIATTSTNPFMDVYIDGTVATLQSVDITNFSIKQITTTGYLTYETDDGVVQIGNAVDGGSNEELITNGDFDTDIDGWQNSGDGTVEWDNGTLKCTNSNASWTAKTKTETSTVVGRTYHVTFDINTFGNSAIVQIPTSNTYYNTDVITSFEVIFIATGTTSDINFAHNNNTLNSMFNIDNVSVKEVLPNSTTYTLVDDTYRWAYVNENPFSEADLTEIAEEPNKIVEFAMDGTGLTNTQGVDDKFYGFRENSGAYCVDALAGYGANLITNGDFELGGTDWTPTGQWVIADGKASCTATATSLLIQDTGDLSGKIVIFEFDLSNYVIGTLSATFFGSTNTTINITGNGKYGIIIGLTAGHNGNSGFTASTGFDGEVDNISIREATASEIANYTISIRTATANSQTSIQWTCAELDGAGVPTAYNSTPNTIRIHSDTDIDTQWDRSEPAWTVIETREVDQYHYTSEGNRYKNGIADGTYTAKALVGGTVRVTSVAFDGTVGQEMYREDLKVYETVRTAAEILADHNKWISATYTVLTDGSGIPLVDANGVYLYTT